MGQAKRRGTFKERFALAKQKQDEHYKLLSEQIAKANLALTESIIPKPKVVGHTGHKELLPLITAFSEGKTTQIFSGGVWSDIKNMDPWWDSEPKNYRIKPEPKKYWLVRYMGQFTWSVWESSPYDSEALKRNGIEKYEIITVQTISD